MRSGKYVTSGVTMSTRGEDVKVFNGIELSNIQGLEVNLYVRIQFIVFLEFVGFIVLLTATSCKPYLDPRILFFLL